MGENFTTDKLPRYIKLKDEKGETSIHFNTVSKDCPSVVKLYAEKYLNETEENKRNGIEKLKAYAKKEKLPDLEDIYLKAILRCCKYDIGKCQLKLKKFWNVRRLISKNLKKIDAEKLEHLIEDGFTQCLPWSDKYGRPIYVFRPKMNLDHYNFEEMAIYAAACIFCVLEYPLPTINGIVVLVDCSFKNPLMLLKWAYIAKKYFSLENSIPLRIGRVDLINTNIIIQYFFAIVRPVLSSKIISRVGFYGSDLSQLHKIYHPDILPDDFGGTLGPLDTKLFREERLKIINKIKSENI